MEARKSLDFFSKANMPKQLLASAAIISTAVTLAGVKAIDADRAYGQDNLPEQTLPETEPAQEPQELVECLGRTATIVGTAKDEKLKGTSGDDVIAARGGADTIYGLNGNDLICGEGGDDTVRGGQGADRIEAGDGSDSVLGDSGNDKLSGKDGMDMLYGGTGKDQIFGGEGNDELSGGKSADKLRGESGADWCREGESQTGCETNRNLSGVRGSSAKSGSGRLFTYNVKVEDGIAIDRREVAEEVEDTLGDKRGWTRTGRVAFKRTENSAGTTVILATPRKVDQLCAPLNTRGKVSCRQGNRVILNLDRWRYAVPHWPKGADGKKNVQSYRQMLINHEIGHRIGFGHSFCSGPGKKAPVMQQQTKFLSGCKANPWPLPSEVGRL